MKKGMNCPGILYSKNKDEVMGELVSVGRKVVDYEG